LKRVILTLSLIILFSTANCQSIGINGSTLISINDELKNAFGIGVYINIEDSLEQFGVILFFDYQYKNDDFNNCAECPTKDAQTSFQNLSLGLSGIWINKLNSKVKFKFGPLVNYNNTEVNRSGKIATWGETIKSNSIGCGLLINLSIQQIFKLPLNFDVFINPAYSFNTNNKTCPVDLKSAYLNDMSILNFKIGLSYKIK